MDRAELLEQLTDDILAYVMHGAISEDQVAGAIKPDDLDDRFAEYELLLDLHFILLPDTVEFVEKLPQRLRSLRTDTESVSRRTRGGIDGRIDWSSTYKHRYSEAPGDRSAFVCEHRTENYDTAENLVFKRLVSVIDRTLREADEYLREEYAWVQERWNGPQIEQLQRIVEQNVHIRRIRDPEEYEPTDRMLTTALESRSNLYRDAAKLLRTRRELFDGDPSALERLLQETAITPEDDETLLELFVLFRMIGALEGMDSEVAQFETIATDRQEIARLRGVDDVEIVLYHDNSGRDRNLSFRPVPDETDDLSRTEAVHTTGLDVANTYFRDKSLRTQTGRPDLIVLEIDHGDQQDYLITEVKNSTHTATIRQGITETLEYLAFLRENDEFVFGNDEGDSYFGSGWNGLLVVQDLATETASVADQTDSELTILQASELQSELETIVSALLD